MAHACQYHTCTVDAQVPLGLQKKTLCWQQNEIFFISTMIYFEWRLVDQPRRSKLNELTSSMSCELQDRVSIRIVTFTVWWDWGWWIPIPWFLHHNVMDICLLGQPIPCSSLFIFHIALSGLYGCCPSSDVLFCWRDKTNGWANTHRCAALPEGMIHLKCISLALDKRSQCIYHLASQQGAAAMLVTVKSWGNICPINMCKSSHNHHVSSTKRLLGSSPYNYKQLITFNPYFILSPQTLLIVYHHRKTLTNLIDE